jgi:metal-sulfur cluster biosynthetic enzyme
MRNLINVNESQVKKHKKQLNEQLIKAMRKINDPDLEYIY